MQTSGRTTITMNRHRALLHFCGAALAVSAGVAAAAASAPGGFDPAYTVISKLASPRHNPVGGPLLAAGLLVAMLLLLPTVALLGATREGARKPRLATAALRLGIAGGIVLGLEGVFRLDFSGVARKGHEIVALLTFAGLYGGVLGMYVHRLRRGTDGIASALLVALPLVGVGASQFGLYFGQRDLGWVNTGWREMGVPLWLSFAFWQWLAALLLFAGFGHLLATAPRASTAWDEAASTQ